MVWWGGAAVGDDVSKKMVHACECVRTGGGGGGGGGDDDDAMAMVNWRCLDLFVCMNDR